MFGIISVVVPVVEDDRESCDQLLDLSLNLSPY
jgi:hypothetical protein